MNSLLDVQGLTVSYHHKLVVKGISFSLAPRERLGIVGESGSGKSQTVRAIADLLGIRAQVSLQRLAFDGVDLTAAHASERAALRGTQIGMIMQDPGYSLNPGISVGEQIAEMYRVHRGLARGGARQAALQAMQALHIEAPERVYHRFAHELSGGMGQRVMIVMMLAAEPKLLIADEPTSSLDKGNARAVLELLDQQVRDRQMGLILISHDLDAIAGWCDRVLVMRNGEIIDQCLSNQLGYDGHPYTRALLACIPRPGDHGAPLATLQDFDLEPAR
ncbi:peptide/nickel transport system ATP-binding protein [Pseudomonas sp. URIL14HWK12:I8]|uniref:ABC transporter ATP-binding protein n=1 Tax=unclassified Pseudomonas TaxID=196821 RepID=UPI000417B1D7|nr:MULTISPECIES: ABC transporter ATP-binding protein [unclassified Pseudomonas]SNB62888.1 peptide/nickel transport system ATP-binding protein [Pseudomonas sp. URIL14HWK12:I8]